MKCSCNLISVTYSICLHLYFCNLYPDVQVGLNSTGESIGFQGWPEYFEPGDWLDNNAGGPPNTVLSPSETEQEDMPAVQEIPP